MDRDCWLKASTKFSNVCGANPVKNQITSFNGRDSYFDDLALIHTEHQNIQPFILKACKSVNNHPKNIEPNYKLKSL